jgi:hypothetical protein
VWALPVLAVANIPSLVVGVGVVAEAGASAPARVRCPFLPAHLELTVQGIELGEFHPIHSTPSRPSVTACGSEDGLAQLYLILSHPASAPTGPGSVEAGSTGFSKSLPSHSPTFEVFEVVTKIPPSDGSPGSDLVTLQTYEFRDRTEITLMIFGRPRDEPVPDVSADRNDEMAILRARPG